MRWYAPDNASDPRHHYGAQYVRDFTYTFMMAPDQVAGADVARILDWLMAAQNNRTGESRHHSYLGDGFLYWTLTILHLIYLCRTFFTRSENKVQPLLLSSCLH